MINRTGLSMFETDGPYGGGACASKTHDYHSGEADSIYWQTRLQGELYADLRRSNVFINQPDNYFYWGGSKTGMGSVPTIYIHNTRFILYNFTISDTMKISTVFQDGKI